MKIKHDRKELDAFFKKNGFEVIECEQQGFGKYVQYESKFAIVIMSILFQEQIYFQNKVGSQFSSKYDVDLEIGSDKKTLSCQLRKGVFVTLNISK